MTRETTPGNADSMIAPAPRDHPGPALLARETRTTEGEVGIVLGEVTLAPGQYWLDGDTYLLRTPGDIRFRYRKGEGVTVQRPPGADPREEELFLNGGVYAAAACINGFYPIHASAVTAGDRVFAFTGPSGAGKSTLAAQLDQLGLALFCDDTLVLDLSDPARILCLPGHKRLKLMPDAIELTGTQPIEPVGGGVDKLYARPAGEPPTRVLPLAELFLIEEGEPARIVPIRGAAKLACLQDDHYTADLFLAANRPDRKARFDQLARLAAGLDLSRFVRPRDAARFALDAGLIAAHVRSAAGE